MKLPEIVAEMRRVACEHGNRPARCEKCAGVRHATGPTDEQRATIRAALAEAQELRKTQGTP